ncbi:hypothetical protein QBC47DRAFT_116420 [Echria macrotheca]|uniref:Guanylate-binding protein N-terminal domain-containing protein n=1 Tax=Echria macrotheca TaxID=438768 RepID=A0AAJ0BK79_9PEZI|nr:hypothetical protein QBC47DRAFT_116420 [Echria macrotheca]
MSLGGAISASNLAALARADDGSSVALRWLDMIAPAEPFDNATEEEEQPYFLQVVEDPTNNMIRLVRDPLNLISVMGPARSGKSTLMNLLAGSKTELFATYPGMETFTKGVYVPTRVLTLPQFSTLEGDAATDAADPNIKVTFVDTEGQGAVGASYDLNLFSPALTASRVVIYNRTGGLLTEEILGQLGMMVQAAQRLRAAGSPDGDAPATTDTQTAAPTFGHLFVLFNQFRLNSVDTADTLRDKLFKPEKETNSLARNRNEIRKLLASVFESTQVFILPDKLRQVARDGLSDGTKKFLVLEDFEDEYRTYFGVLRRKLSQALQTPRELTPGQPLTGGAMADFMPLFTDAINRSEPLHVASIFEAGQREAAAKSKISFTSALTKLTDGYTAQEAKPTAMLNRLLDNDIALLLAQVAVALSYMAVPVVARVQEECKALAEPFKTALLAANFTRLKATMATALLSSINTLNQAIEDAVTSINGANAQSLLVPVSRIDSIVDNLAAGLVTDLGLRAEAIDPASLPDGWRNTMSTAAKTKKAEMLSRIEQAWVTWVMQTTQTAQDALTADVIRIGKEVGIGENDTYQTMVDAALETQKRALVNKLATEYQGVSETKEQILDRWATAAESVVKLQAALRSKNQSDLTKELQRLEGRIKLEYQEQLRKSIEPGVEPLGFWVATDEKLHLDRFLSFCQNNNISESMSDEVDLRLRSFISTEKRSFQDSYNRACDEFASALSKDLKLKVPPLLSSFQDDLDQIDLTTTKASVQEQCDRKTKEISNRFEALKTRFQLQPDGVVSKPILDAARHDLDDTMRQAVKGKLDKYDEVVSAYNKALLSTIVVPIVNNATSFKYATLEALRQDADKAKVAFLAKAHGNKDGDATVKWEQWMQGTYPILQENVRAGNAFRVGNTGVMNKKVQLEVIQRIWRSAATMANALGMSWVSPATFTGKPEDRGFASVPNFVNAPAGLENDRVFRLTNTNIEKPSDPDGFDTNRATNLEFLDWTVEISKIYWGKPVVTDIRPLKLNTTQFPPQPKEFPVQVGNVDTVATTLTDSTTWGVNAGFKYTYKVGDSKLGGEDSFEFSGGFKVDWAHTSTTQSTYTTDTRATFTLPANRSTVIHQMVFDQKTSLPYTAQVKIVPRLRFQNGFTVWGGGGSYKDNPNTAAIKDKEKGGKSRVYKDFDFRRVDKILEEDAAEDADPWFWHLAMQRKPQLKAALEQMASDAATELYVRGWWEGITGKYAVTTVVPGVTPLTLLPQEV